MPRRRSLAEILHVGEVDEEELTIVLTSVLPRSAQFLSNKVEYRTMGDELALTLVYSGGHVVDALAGPEMGTDLEEQLQQSVERDLIVPVGQKIWRQVMFSSRPVVGSWRLGNEFQVVPVPPDAPRPGMLWADHPFVLDFTFEHSPNWSVTQLRVARRTYELTLLFALFLTDRIRSLSNRAQGHWVLPPVDPDADSASQFPRWAQNGYFMPNFNHIVDALPDHASVSPIQEVEVDAYYDPWDFTVRSDALTIPTALPELFDCADQLQGGARERFFRACYWHQTARTVWTHSQSLHLSCLINAVECLASIGPERHTPSGPTVLFKKFMKRHAPGSPSATTVDALYDVRSHVAHGERLLYFDQLPGGHALTQTSTADSQTGDDAARLCRGALINWLWAQEHNQSDRLITRGLRKVKPPLPGTKSAVEIIIPNTAD